MEIPGEQLLLCFIVLILSSCVDQLGGEGTLAGMVGGSITFSKPVKEDGTLFNSKGTITRLNAGNSQTYNENYTERILWDKQSGMFTLIRLTTADSGVYTVENLKARKIATYHLNIYEPVPAPTVNVSAVSRESCSLVCLLEKTGGDSSMLSWYRKDKLLNQTSRFSLPLVVDTEHYTSSYSCLSSNPVDNKTVLVNIATTCGSGSYKGNKPDGDDKRKFVIPLVVGLFALFLTMVIMVMVRRKRRGRDKQSQDSAKRDEDEITYADVTVVQSRDQEERWGLSELPMDRSNLTTVYDTLEVHQMTLTETDTEAV